MFIEFKDGSSIIKSNTSIIDLNKFIFWMFSICDRFIAKLLPEITYFTSIGISARVRSNKKYNCIWLIIDHKVAIDAVFMIPIIATSPKLAPVVDKLTKLHTSDAAEGTSINSQFPDFRIYLTLHTSQILFDVFNHLLQFWEIQFCTVSKIFFTEGFTNPVTLE